MFKYKSPLSRLLEGAGKAKEAEETAAEVEQPEKAEPIADFNALRQALAGGNMTTDSYEETDELIPEEKMPEFGEADTASDDDVEIDQAPAIEDISETPDIQDHTEDEQVVTLHLAATEDDDTVDPSAAEPESTPDAPQSAAAPYITPDPISVEPEPEQEPVSAEAPTTQPEPDATTQDRRSRVKTTFLGFERPDTHVQDLIETTEPVAKIETAGETFPVGWLVVTGGPGRGASITLKEGLMQIGRNDDQAIQLDFGDTGISRSNHAVIAYDPEDRKCYLGHGGKANLVRLNGKPVLSTVPLSGGDLIRISETSIRFVPFCDDSFDWRDA